MKDEIEQENHDARIAIARHLDRLEHRRAVITEALPALDLAISRATAALSALKAIPESPPAALSGIQSEGPENKGADLSAQKDDPAPDRSEVNATKTDQRNSSRGAEQQAVNGKPPAPRMADGSLMTKGEHVLRLWSQTSMSKDDIAKEARCALASVSAFVAVVRQAGDPRANARGFPAIENPKPAPAPAQAPPPAPKPINETPTAPSNPAPAVRAPAVAPEMNTGVVSIDMERYRILGPKGIWTCGKGIALTIARMNSGALLASEVLAKAGGWNSAERFDADSKFIRDRLADIGVRLITVPKIGHRIEVIA